MSPNPSVSIKDPKKRAREIPKGSGASEKEVIERKIRDAMHDLRLSSTARDPQAIAWRANVDVALVRAYLAQPALMPALKRVSSDT